MIKSETLKSNLLNKGVNPEAIDSEPDYLFISEPGVSINDISDFIKGTLSEFGDFGDVIPNELPIGNITLSSLQFFPSTGTDEPLYLRFILKWAKATWQIIPGTVALAEPKIEIIVVGSNISAEISGDIIIHEIPLNLAVELPNSSFRADLKRDETEGGQSATALLNSFQIGSTNGNRQGRPGLKLESVTLNDLSLLGNIRARRALFHLALSKIPLGHGKLATQLTIDYTGGANSQLSGMIWGQYNISRKGSNDDTLFSLMLLAAYDGPGKSWKFEGGAVSGSEKAVSVKDLIEAFTDADGIPGIFAQLGIKYLHLAYETGPGNFEFQCDVEVDDLFGENANVELIVDVRLQKVGSEGGQYEKTFSGRLLFNLQDDTVLEFDLLFDQSPHGQTSETTLLAAYKNPSGGDIDVGDLIRLIEPDLDVPLSIKLQDAFFIYDKHAKQDNNTARSSSLFGLDIGGGIDLSALPLVGKIVAKDTSLTFGVQPLVAFGTTDSNNVYFSANDLATISAMIPGGGITLPARDIKEQIALGINIAIGEGTSFHFDLPILLNSKVQKKPTPPPKIIEAQKAIGPTNDAMTTSPATEGTTPAPTMSSASDTQSTEGTTSAPAVSSASGIQWIKIGKGFGPVQFNRIGLQFEKDEMMVWAYLDASLSMAALTFTLNGLGVGTSINELNPQFRLLGIGIDYKSGPVEIGASFLRTHNEAVIKDGREITPAHDEYSGLATIKTPAIGLSAIGSYADLPDYKSLFIYAVLNAPLGGPSFFFVTGLAAGFGFNRAVKVPDVSLVGEFPLVNLAVGGAGSPVPDNPAGRTNYIHDILDQLRDSIYPMKGQYFLAAGIHFTSFELIDSFVLLIVSFGEHFEVDVLGLSTLVAPPPTPGSKEVTPIAEVQLALKAVFNPSEGILSVEAVLTGNSFILDRDCHLTGGFAFYSWFAGPHAGDFVLSLGGYHPDFQKPAHYPSVPRLGLNWQVTSDLSIKGGIYFALCSHMVMAGGKLEAIYQSGSKKASFSLAADFLVSWKPYHYDAKVSLDIHVDYTYHMLGTHHISVNIDAGVHVWGPDFAGHAHLHLSIVSFDIDFGAKTTPKLEPLSWDEFQKSFLPEDESKMVQISVMNGLIRKEKSSDAINDDIKSSDTQSNDTKSREYEQVVINPKEFQLGINLVIPFRTLTFGQNESDGQTLQNIKQVMVKGTPQIVMFGEEAGSYVQAEIGDTIATSNFGIAPMGRSASQIDRSHLQIIAEKADAEGNWTAVNEDFGFRPVLKRVPRALWGETLTQELNGERYVENVLSGLEILPAKQPQPGETHWIAKKELQYTTTHVEPGIGFEPITGFDPAQLVDVDSAKTDLRTHLNLKEIMKNRQELLKTLGFDYDRLGLELNPTIVDSLVFAPQIGTLADTAS